MKLGMPVPYEKLLWFQEKLDLREEDLKKVQEYGDLFIQKKGQFGDHLYQFLYAIQEVRFILERERTKGFLRRTWAQWFELLFTQGFSHEILGYLWRSGLRHVEMNIDKRLINLAYARVRQFCQDIAWRQIPLRDREAILAALGKMVDFCVLVETHAYVSATFRCDMEVVKGISHQVRNPLMVIGGNITRLQKAVKPGSQAYMTYETILEENKRLGMMVNDVVAYSEMFQREPSFTALSLTEVISDALKKLEETHSLEKVQMDFSLDAGLPKVHGDPNDLVIMFYQLLQDSLEAVDAKSPCIRISGDMPAADAHFVKVEIFNTGKHLTHEEIPNIFVPFYSSKPYGTGLGLPMAQLAARRNFGQIAFEPLEDLGTRCIIWLPITTAPETD